MRVLASFAMFLLLLALGACWVDNIKLTPRKLPGLESGVIPCGSDAECHRLNPGLCADDEPYCFAGGPR